MKKEKGKKIYVNIWAIVVALSMFCVCMFAGVTALFIVNKKDKRDLENVYNSYAYTLYDSLNNLEIGLSKLMVSPERAQNITILLDCYRHAEIASSALSCLPIALDGESSCKAINQIGDYVKAYALALTRNKDCLGYQKNSEEFFKTSVTLKSSAAKILENLNKGEKITNMGRAFVKQNIKNDTKHHSVEYPEIIYDGVFSDGKTPKHFKILENKPEITEQDAIKKVKESLDTMKNRDIKCVGKTNSDEPCFQLMTEGGEDEASFSVTVRGGLIVNYNINRKFSSGKLSERAAREIAENAAEKMGYSAKSVWYNSSDNVATINLAPIIDEIIFYPDLVKVKVALFDGEVVGLEASGYCLNTCVRTLKPTMTVAAAQSMVSKKLNIVTTRLAVIPLGESEVLTYEIAATYNGLQYFVYIDAFNGEELKIFRVIDSYQGKMTI